MKCTTTRCYIHGLMRTGVSVQPQSVRRRDGFTLIELLVVIAIIAVLVALLLPGLRKARGMALETVCRGQLHQIGVALENYRSENADWFPFGWWQGSVTAPYGHAYYPTWDWVLLPYLEDNRKIFRCPADPLLFERTYTYNAQSNERVWGPWRFLPPWCNDSCTPPCWSKNLADGTRTAHGLDTFLGVAVERPAETVSISELNTNWVYDYAQSYGGDANYKLGQIGYWWHSIHSGDLTPADNHNGGAIYLMVDAHVEKKAAAEMPYDAVTKTRMAQTMWWYYRKKP